MLFSQAIEIQEMTPQLLVFVWGIIQSLGLEYVPGVAPWYSKRDDVQKRAIQAGGLLLVTVGILGLSCVAVLSGIECNQAGITGMFVTYFLALMANQTTHSVFRKKKSAG
jgi:hypothetical protein